ncbi:MAG: hypothetical protein K0R24_346 [Gammaproteobacteria bacterium]|jgi:type-F conjugative transfer system secretin TraK|nr:hypothetical protein [Gammaproteobacteria bacterium]
MRNITVFILLISAIVGFQGRCYALQMKLVQDNQTVFAKISSKQLSQIFVTDDRILSVRGVEGEYQLTKDEQRGVIFIRAVPSSERHIITLLISTEKEHSYTVLLAPLDIPSETIELRPLSPAKKIAEHWEKNSPYTELLVTLLYDMVNEIKPEGYAVISLSEGRTKKLAAGVTMRLMTLYRGNQLQGEIWKLKNESKITQIIRSKDFYQPDSRAISVLNEELHQNDETLLYRVVDHVR